MSRILVAVSLLLLAAPPMHAQRVAPGARPGAPRTFIAGVKMQF